MEWKDPQEYTDSLRRKWGYMDASEKAERAHEATNYAAFVVEEAYLAGKITDDARKATLLVLGVSCAAMHEQAD